MTADQGSLGEGSRLTEGPSPLMAEFTFGFELDTYAGLWRWLSIADMAHARELGRAGVLPDGVESVLLPALFDAHHLDPPELDASIGDLYNNRDSFLRHHLGDVADWIHTGRARREATTLAWQLETRSQLERATAGVVALVRALVDVASAHVDTVMPDFTYLQHAQPTTLGHYLLGFAYPLSRDLDRLAGALSRVNRCPAGSGSVNGTRHGLDRTRMALDLEFDDAMVHTRDAMWAPDLAIEPSAIAMSAFVTIDRIAEELQVWATSEFGFFHTSDRHSRTSVVMPQKKNPYGLAMIRGLGRAQLGELVAVVATNLTVSGQPDNRILSYGVVPGSLHKLAGVSALLAEHLTDGEFDTSRMRDASGSGFTSATEICDWLTENHAMSNRHAHRLVGYAVRRAIDDERDLLSLEDLREASVELGLELPDIGEDQLADLQDPEVVLASRTGVGSAADVEAMVGELRSALDTVPSPRFGDFEERYLKSIRAEIMERRAE